MDPVLLLRKICAFPDRCRTDHKIKELPAYDLAGYKRVYLIHIRKTGGTSINNMFLALGDSENPAAFYQELAAHPDHRLIRNGKVFVGWNKKYINEGRYFYAFSHVPLHQLSLPEGTFTVTCFRDPVKRVISHYRMLHEYREKNIKHPCMQLEGPWLGNSFDDFLNRIPPQHLLNQLYMFSEDFDINQALERILKVSHVFFTEDFDDGVKGLNEKLQLHLQPFHLRKTRWDFDIPDDQRARLRCELEREYALLERIREKMTVV